jgi:Domain of unknown function (DUF4203)
MMWTFSVVALAAIAIGLLQCFAGYRIFRVVLGITGFMIGAVLAGYLVYHWTSSPLFTLIAAVIGGLIGAFLLGGLYKLGIFVIGAIFGVVATTALFALSGSTAPGWLLAVIALVCAILAVIFQKLMIVIATSFGGSWWAISGIASLTGAVKMESLQPAPLGLQEAGAGWLVAWLLLGVAGMIVQFRSNHSR